MSVSMYMRTMSSMLYVWRAVKRWRDARPLLLLTIPLVATALFCLSGGRQLDDRLDVLLYMVDNRPIPLNASWERPSYHVLSAAINFVYAERHGYEFRYYQVDPLNLTAVERLPGGPEAIQRYDLWIASSQYLESDKDAAAVFHPALGAVRAAPYLKLLPSYAIAAEQKHDVAVFLDTDVVIRAANHTFERFYELYQDKVGWGKQQLRGADVAFYADLPWSGPDKPISCFWLFKPRSNPGFAERFFLAWHDGLGNDLNHKSWQYEQSVLWQLAPRFSEHLSVVNAPQYGDGGPDSFIAHYTADLRRKRAELLKAHLSDYGIRDQASFSALIARMHAMPGAIRRVDPLEAALSMVPSLPSATPSSSAAPPPFPPAPIGHIDRETVSRVHAQCFNPSARGSSSQR